VQAKTTCTGSTTIITAQMLSTGGRGSRYAIRVSIILLTWLLVVHLAHWQRQITSTTTLDNKGGISKYAINSNNNNIIIIIIMVYQLTTKGIATSWLTWNKSETYSNVVHTWVDSLSRLRACTISLNHSQNECIVLQYLHVIDYTSTPEVWLRQHKRLQWRHLLNVRGLWCWQAFTKQLLDPDHVAI